jgi:hypothetical protein
MTKLPDTSYTSAQIVPLAVAPCSAWTRIEDGLPKYGDRIACCAEHRNGGMMYWAGRVVRVRNRFALIEVRDPNARRFILTFDTMWLRLPPLPNVQDEPRGPKHP